MVSKKAAKTVEGQILLESWYTTAKCKVSKLDFLTSLVLRPLQKLLLQSTFRGSNIPNKNSKLVLYYKKNLSKHNHSKKFDGKNHYHPSILTTIKKWEVVEFFY